MMPVTVKIFNVPPNYRIWKKVIPPRVGKIGSRRVYRYDVGRKLKGGSAYEPLGRSSQ
jgi:hypothetical protein